MSLAEIAQDVIKPLSRAEKLQLIADITKMLQEEEKAEFELFPKDQYELAVIPERESKVNGEKNELVSLKRGSAKNIITYIAEDFDEPLEDFKEYML